MFLYKWTISLKEYFDLNLNDVYKQHKTIWGLFGDLESNRKWLYLVKLSKGNAKFYIRTEDLITNSPNFGTIEKIIDNFKEIQNDTVLFEIRLNPVKTISIKNKKNPKRIAIKKEELEIWVHKKLKENEIQVNNLEIGDLTWTKSLNKNIEFQTCDVKCNGKILNKEKFLEIYKRGIGKEKSFGCGMFLFS